MLELARKVIDEYFKAKEENNFSLIANCFWQNENLFYIGSDEGEVWRGWDLISEFLKKQVEAFEYFNAKRKRIWEKEILKDKVYIFVEENEVTVKTLSEIHINIFLITIIVENIEGEFKITFLHRSLPSKEAVFPYLKGTVRYL